MKKYRQVHNYIFGLFFICLLICGVCVDDVSTPSFFHAQNEVTQNALMPDEEVVSAQEIWDEEEVLLQQRDLRSLQYTRRDNYRGCWRNIVDLLLLGFSLPMLFARYSFSNRRHIISGFSHKFIIGYIHHTDGEKSF